MDASHTFRPLEKIKVAIIEDDLQLSNSIESYMLHSEEFEVVGTATDGLSGLDLIRKGGIDVVLLDLILPFRDGIFVLEEWNAEKNLQTAPSIIILSSLMTHGLAAKVLCLGADYYILKPFALEVLCRRIIDAYQYQRKNELSACHYTNVSENKNTLSPETFAAQMLHQVEVGNNLKGYVFLKEAIVLCIQDQTNLTSITKWLYPTIAKKYTTTDKNVERAIRHALDLAWKKDDGENLYKIFSLESLLYKRPTTGKFLNLIVEAYQLNSKTPSTLKGRSF